jgi:hypothetical protein
MKRWMIMTLALCLPSPAGAEEERAFLRFANKGFDQISGSLESLGGDRLVWNSPILQRPTPFYLKDLLELSLPTVIPEFKADHEATLTLNMWPDQPPSQVKGQLVSVTDDKVVLDTWYAGRMEFQRVMVKGVDIEDRASLLYTGPTGLDGWIQGSKTPTWIHDRGVLRTTAAKTLTRDLKLPDECMVAFNLAWKENLNLHLNLFCDAESENASRGYQINCQGSYATIRRFSSGIGGNEMVGVPEFRENEKVRIEVRISRKAGHVCFYVNGRYAAYWKDPEAGKGKMGGAIQFAPLGTVAGLSISRIKVTTWDGVPEESPDGNVGMMGLGGIRRMGMGNAKPAEQEKPKEKPDQGRMKLRNGDSIGGEVMSISDGQMLVKTPFAEVKLPVFRLDSLTRETVTGSSQTFGKAEFKLSAFNRIEFNIHDPAINDLRAEEGGK